MKKMGKKKWIAILMALTMLMLSACGKDSNAENGENGSENNKNNTTESKDDSTESNNVTIDFTDFYVSTDMILLDTRDTDTSEEKAVTISLNGDSVSAENAGGVSISGTTVTITAAGTYLLNGTLKDGELIVDVDKEEEVHLIFDGVAITNLDGPAVYAKHGLITITLKDGTTSTLTDGAEPAIPEGEDEAVGACLYSKDNLTLNGEGTLVIQANYKDGINCKDVLKLVSGQYEITAADDGIVGKDAVWVLGGTGTITAGGDGIKSTNVEKEESGYLYFDKGSFTITAGADGLQADSSMLIDGGTLTLTTGGGSKNAAAHSDDMFWGRPGSNTTSTTESDSSSSKGIKAGANLMINGGVITADCADDTLHSDGTITIQDGTMTLTAGDDGIHAEESVTINGGVITITKSYEGIEARIITVNDGTVKVTASDDGLNATAGSSTTSQGFGFGFGGGMDEVQDAEFVMNGGFLYMNADGDGLDSNGTAVMTGGICIVDGPTNSGNGALDYAASFTVTGGVLVAAGASGMAMTPNEEGQGFVSMSYTSTQSAGSVFAITDADGKVVLAFTPAKTYSHIVVSAPELTSGATLKLYTGGSVTGEAQCGLYQSGAVYTAGTQVAEFAITDAANYFNESGKTTGTTGSFGGMGGFGGGGRGGNRDENRGNKNPWNQNSDSEEGTTDGEKLQMPDGEMPSGEVPQMPDGEMPSGEMPQMPDGEMPSGEMPQMPDGEMPSGEMPQMPDGEMPQE